MKTLVITDVQRDFYDPSGKLYVAGGELLPQKIMAIQDKYDAIVFTMDWHPGNHCSFKDRGGIWPQHCVAYTAGASLPDVFIPILACGPSRVRFFFKGRNPDLEEYGAFNGLSDGTPENSAILEWFKASDEIHICGIAGDYCVKETAAKLLNYIPKEKLKILTECIVSIDGGATLDAFINTL